MLCGGADSCLSTEMKIVIAPASRTSAATMKRRSLSLPLARVVGKASRARVTAAHSR
jgi:hypothetical protein